MKRIGTILAALSFALTLSAILFSFSIESDAGFRAGLSQILAFAALCCFILSVSMRSGERHAAAVSTTRGAISDAHRQSCSFSDVAANEEALESLETLRDYLSDPEKYARYGARMPRGVLMYGPPGTGKTLLARALAGEARVPFFALSGSDFVEKYVGVGASRVRELFKRARKVGRCVIFIDEIDALGKRRDDSSADERDQTLNALLSEMSGFYTGDGIVVIAATNRMEALDPALLRPGRFDRLIEVGLPGRAQRLDILKKHSKDKPLDEDVDLEELAARTVSFSGASLEALLNEAALLAAERNDGGIGREDLRVAFYKTVAGSDRPITATEAERRSIAIHEAGHALASRLLAPENQLERVSILPAGHGAAGYNLCVPAERVMVEKRHIEAQICVLLAGRAAEQLILGDEAMTAGASSDIARATELSASMVTELGMAGEPAVSLKALNRCCGGAGDASERSRALLSSLYEKTYALLAEHIRALDALSGALISKETLTGEEAENIIDEHMSNERHESI